MIAPSHRWPDPWKASRFGFPIGAPLDQQLEFCLSFAVLAPSGHNSQPWLFSVEREHIDLFCDRSRSLPALDPNDREMIISCGAALGHLQVAMRYFGLVPLVALFPDERCPDHLARISVSEWAPGHRDCQKFDAIQRRRTYRLAFEEVDVTEETVDRLVESAGSEGAWLRVVRGAQSRLAVAELVRRADRALYDDADVRDEQADWLCTAAALSPLARFVVRHLDLGAPLGAREKRLALNAPLLCVLGTSGDTPADWVIAGQALSSVLLTATSKGVSASFLDAPIELPEYRGELRRIVGASGHPQLLLRMGYGHAILPAPRRSVDEVLLQRGRIGGNVRVIMKRFVDICAPLPDRRHVSELDFASC